MNVENNGKCFTVADDSFIKMRHSVMSDKQIGSIIGRTETSIQFRRYRLGITRKRDHWQKEAFIKRALTRMQELIKICETTKSPYQKDKAKEELKKLSGL